MDSRGAEAGASKELEQELKGKGDKMTQKDYPSLCITCHQWIKNRLGLAPHLSGKKHKANVEKATKRIERRQINMTTYPKVFDLDKEAKKALKRIIANESNSTLTGGVEVSDDIVADLIEFFEEHRKPLDRPELRAGLEKLKYFWVDDVIEQILAILDKG